jgi:hypothetical protein
MNTPAAVVFALAYLAVGIENLKNAEGPTAEASFMNAFFFSAHTLSTVGYGAPIANRCSARLPGKPLETHRPQHQSLCSISVCLCSSVAGLHPPAAFWYRPGT